MSLCVWWSWGHKTLEDKDQDRHFHQGDLLLASGLVLSWHFQDTAGINVKGDLNLSNATKCMRNSFQVELSQHKHSRLVVSMNAGLLVISAGIVVFCSINLVITSPTV